jgi:hypothetical protein
VRAHVPWYWRVTGALLLLLLAMALVAWVYDSGRRFAGFDHGESEQQRTALSTKSATLEQELTRLRSIADVSESKLKIELTAQQQLAHQVQLLEDENARLKEDLSIFESLARAEGQEGDLYINRLRVDPEGTDRYHYRMLLAVQGGKKTGEFSGNMQLAVTLQRDGKSVTMIVPSAEDPTASAAAKSYALNFKHFRRVDGTFQIPSGSRLKALEVRLFDKGALKASKRVIF